MKNLLKTFLVVVVVIVSSFFVWEAYNNYVEKPMYIAFIGPMSGPGAAAGRRMIFAIALYLEDINKSRDKLKGKKVELKIFDDQNDCSGRAKTEAKKIVNDPQILAVIGHWYSGCSIAGGAIYKKYGLLAITPGSMKKEVTENNEWYFRNIYTTKTSSSFLAHYVNKVFRHNKVAIISDGSSYGSYTGKVFEETARKLNMDIKSWNYDYKFTSKEKKQFFQEIVDQLAQKTNDTEVIMLAMQAGDNVELVKMIKDSNIDKIIIGGGSLSEDTFKFGFDDFPREKTNPGYYTNGIYVTIPLLFDAANEKAQQFLEKYQAKYDEEPDWSAAYAYDSIMVLIKAMKYADIHGKPETLKADREKIREALASFTNLDEAIEGTTGFNYFDENRDAQKLPMVGMYKNKNLVSTFTQSQAQAMRDIREEVLDFDKSH